VQKKKLPLDSIRNPKNVYHNTIAIKNYGHDEPLTFSKKAGRTSTVGLCDSEK
jgi:hypothetical protein